MHRFLSYLQNHKWLNITIAIIYYLIVVTTHKKVGRLVAQNLDKPLGRDNYNLLVLLVGSSVLLFSVAFFYKRFKNNLDIREKQKVLFSLGLLLALIIVAVNVIMVVNVEIIHIAQYCVMAILVFPLLKNFNLTMLCTTILGVIDEAYQYWYLFPEKSDYFDFNDVIINFLGVILGLIIVRSQGFKSLINNKVWYKSSFFYLVIFIIIISSLGLIFGIISTSPNLEESSALIELVRKHKPGFWRIIPPQVKFHVIRPLEFVFLIFILMGLFRKLGQ
jgi:glycopeptide antibiotics resistance protein